MKRFSLEHVGITTSDPVAAATWYQRVLGFESLFEQRGARTSNAFLRSPNGVVIELWSQSGLAAVSDRLTDPLELHVALASDDPSADAAYLVEHGATLIKVSEPAANGDQTAALRDPWGNCLQLAKRGAGSFFRE